MTSDPIARYQRLRGAVLDRRARLRPLTTSEVLDTALRVYRSLGWAILRSTVVPTLFCLGAIAFLVEYIVPSLLTTSKASNVNAQVGETALNLLLGLFIGGPLFLIGLSYTTVLVVQIASDYMVGNLTKLEDAQLRTRELLGKMFVVNLREVLLSLAGVGISVALMFVGAILSKGSGDSVWWTGGIVLIGLFGLIGGAIYCLHILGVHSLCAPVTVLEGASPKVAAKRSKELMRTARFQGSGSSTVWSLYCLMFMIGLVLLAGMELAVGLLDGRAHIEGFLAGIPLQGVVLTAFDLLPAFLVTWTIIPIWAATITIIYYDRRIRLEGYDIEALAEDIHRNSRKNRFQL